MRKTVLAATVAACTLLLAGCGTSILETEARVVQLPDGRTVICVVAAEHGGTPGGIACDWGNATPTKGR